jgi:membrane fusion protein (multidrug efflux system)
MRAPEDPKPVSAGLWGSSFTAFALALAALIGAGSGWAADSQRHASATRSVSAPLEHERLRAQLSPRDYTTLAAEIGAKINRIAVKEGGSFRAGEVLVSLDCNLQQAQQARARAELGGAEKLLAANRRLEELNSIGQVELDISVTQLEKMRAELAYVNATLAKCNLIAPFSGRVAEQKAREQQFVQAGQPLLDILDDSALELDFIVPSRWLSWLRAGHRFQVTIDETGRTYPARIVRLGARVDPVSQSVRAAAVIDGKFPDLIAGMSGHLLLSPPTGTP